MKFITLFSILFLTVGSLFCQTIDQQVDSILNLMTLEEKIGQMTQVERGSLNSLDDISSKGIGSLLSGGGSAPDQNNVMGWANMYDEFQQKALTSRLGIPLIYGIDAVHGHNNVYGATIFPHNIGLGCTWNPTLVQSINEIVALEVAATGIDWTFAPCIAVPQNEKWGRTYEGFGESAEIQQLMAAPSVIGLQGESLSDPTSILACAKHFVGDGGTANGIDQGNTIVTEEILRNIHMPGYLDAINAGVGTVMASFNSWNGEKLHGHGYLLTDVLKEELGFEGFVISDWAGVDQVDEDYRTAIKRCINAGIDMVMVPDRYEVFISHLISLVQDNEVPESRIDDAVRRILKQKLLLDLFNEPFSDSNLAQAVGHQDHRDVAQQAVRESLVLLNAKNDVLPLSKNNERILIAGSLANDIGAQCGGWTISWQGDNGAITLGTSILEGIENISENSEILYSENGTYTGQIDKAVVVIGEKQPYAEGAGDRTELFLENSDISLLKSLKQKGIPTIAILISGRPLLVSEALPYTDAFIAAWYPGSEAEGIAEVLFGDYIPSGLLTHSWPKTMSQIPLNIGDANYDPLFPYKYGLTEFPMFSMADSLFPYAASTNNLGDTILLAITTKLENLEVTNSDFEIKINDVVQSAVITEIVLSSFDQSILKIALNSYLEPDDNITLSYKGESISSNGKTLVKITDYYVCNTVNSGAQSNNIPGRIEAENYSSMYGVDTENCNDTGGGLNVGWIDSGDWMEYLVNVGETGTFKITARIAGFDTGSIKITGNNFVETTINFTGTDGWQNWQNFTSTVELEQGVYYMRVEAQTSGFNLNYFDFHLSNAINTTLQKINEINVFPNPAEHQFNLEFISSKNQQIQVKLLDATGNHSQQLYLGNCSRGKQKMQFMLPSNLPKGIYFIEIKNNHKRYFKKIAID